MKYDILNRFSGEVQCSVEIECAADAFPSVKLGLAIKVALSEKKDLRGAYLGGANLSGANLSDKFGNKITLQKTPLQLLGLTWDVLIFDQHMKIGCQFHSLHEWEAFSDREIIAMDGRNAKEFWDTNKEAIFALCRANGRSFEPFVPQPETTAA